MKENIKVQAERLLGCKRVERIAPFKVGTSNSNDPSSSLLFEPWRQLGRETKVQGFARGAKGETFRIAEPSSAAISELMTVGAIDGLSKRAPVIVICTLCAALVGDWVGVPEWLPDALAIVIGSLALVLMAARRRLRPSSTEELDFTNVGGWVAHELAGKGTPPGYYLLGFFGFLTIALIGFQSAYARPAWAAFALGLVWGVVNARYPASEG